MRIKIISLLIVSGFAIYGASKVQLRSPIVEKQEIYQAVGKPVPLPEFQLTANIDQQEEFWGRFDE